VSVVSPRDSSRIQVYVLLRAAIFRYFGPRESHRHVARLSLPSQLSKEPKRCVPRDCQLWQLPKNARQGLVVALPFRGPLSLGWGGRVTATAIASARRSAVLLLRRRPQGVLVPPLRRPSKKATWHLGAVLTLAPSPVVCLRDSGHQELSRCMTHRKTNWVFWVKTPK